MLRETESPADVEKWLQQQAASLWPAGLGSLSLRRSPCIRQYCAACASGKQHPSYVLYVRMKGRRHAIYIPKALVPQIRRCLDNGRALQELLYQTAVRYTKSLKHQKARSVKKARRSNDGKSRRPAYQLR